MKNVILTTVVSICMLLSAIAQQKTSKNWGLEVNVVWPFVPGVEIYTAKATNTVWQNNTAQGDITFGVLIRPGTNNDENAERFSEFGLNLGYRHYFWKGFHAELALYPSLARETNNFADGKDYQGFALTTELYTGYRFTLYSGSAYSWYLMPQAGVGYNPISNLGPSTEVNSPFPTLNLQVGVRF